MKTKLLIMAALLFTGFFFLSCSSSDETGPDFETPEIDSNVSLNIVVDDVLADEIMEDVLEEAEEATSMEYTGLKTNSDTTGNDVDVRKCRERTVTHYGDGSRKITVEYFGECRENQRRIREGKIHILITGRWWSADFTRTITFEDFFINGNKVEGTQIIKQIKDTTDGGGSIFMPKMITEFTYDIKITKENGSIIEKDGKRIRSQIGGTQGQLFCWDFKYQIEGYSDNYKKMVTDSVTTEYTMRMDIIKPLIKNVFWPFYIEGTKQLVINNQDTVLVDYGDGELDAIVTTTTKDTVIVEDLWQVCWGQRMK